MPENKTKPEALAETLSLQLGSPESRAAARMILAGSGRPPSFVVQFVDPARDEQGHLLEEPMALESRTASVAGKTLTRLEGEASEAFRERACAELPALSGGLVVMFADVDESTSATEDPGTVGAAKVAPRIST